MKDKHNQRQLHVSEEEYYEATLLLNAEIKSGDSVEAVLTTNIQKASRQFSNIMSGVAEQLVSVDRSLEEVDEYEAKVTRYGILTGAIAGLVVARTAYIPESINSRTLFDYSEIESLEGDDELDGRHQESTALRDFGWDGMRRIGKRSEDIFEEWEQKLVPDIRFQPLFRIGSGIVLNSAYLQFDKELEDRRQKDFEDFEKELAQVGDLDWDADLSRLLTDGGEQ